MKGLLGLIVFLALPVASPSSQPATACPASPASELFGLDYDAFDTSRAPSAWRSLLDRGCVDAAVATLQAYRKADAGRMTSEQREELSFHMGQALAMSGREREAISHFERAVSRGSAAEWSAYVAANLGFVRKDRKQVEDALAAYEKVAGQNSMRLGFIRGFLRCLDRPYMEAASCGM